MSFEGQQPVKLIGAVAGADLSATTCRYKFVKFTNTTSLGVSLCAATTDIPVGVLQAEAPTSATGQPVEVTVIGETKLQDGGALAAADIIGTNASGQGVAVVAGTYPVGRCLVAGGAANAYAVALVNCVAPTIKA